MVAQGYLFVAPVAHDGLVHLAEDGCVIAVDLVQLLVGTGAQVRVIAAHQAHQFAAGKLLHFAGHFHLEYIAVGERIV